MAGKPNIVVIGRAPILAGPQRLGWTTISMKHDWESVFVQDGQGAEPAAQPAATGADAGRNEVLLAQLTQLGELNARGVLTDDEFSAAKAMLLR
ncbi:SHOCT domain-containing protein [Promicromonospora soli]|uniref:Uncharacterized protein n=1 Tax=Promicromonospora soli TaxID=2035533 RepID=A0A919G763_9MICO|nr:SHOCT domain-containing protein [Promicromonospora soli]GHH79298.1 hypothetical protein GCM10017772_44700 [Promicromonospora soli]